MLSVKAVNALREFVAAWVWAEQHPERKTWTVYIKEDGEEALLAFMDLDEKTANDFVARFRIALWHFAKESMAMIVGLEKEE